MRTHPRSLALCVTMLVAPAACAEDDAADRLAIPVQVETVAEADTGYYQDVSWAPDGSQLVISVLEAGGEAGFRYRLKRIDLRGTEYVTISDGPMDYWTAWSPDGTRILFGSESDGNTDIYSVGPDGAGLLRLTDDPATDTQPAWSPDGSRIAFVSARDGEHRLYTMAANGTDERLLSPDVRAAETPAWSPDGSRIAYFQTDAAGNDSVVVVGIDGSDRTVLAAGVWPSWSPDGTRVVFGRDDALFQIDANGGDPVLITGGGSFGRYSPDGSLIAMIGAEDGDVVVAILRADGTGRSVLLRRPAPNW